MGIQARPLAILGALKYLVVAGVALVLLLVGNLDKLGRTIAIIALLLGIVLGAYRLCRALRLSAEAAVRTVEDLPVSEQEGALRRLRFIFAITISAFTVWTTWDLYRLDQGTIGYVTTFGPSATLYAMAGFWPSVTVLPVLGALGFWHLTRRIRQARQ